jgi:hypothetical protein
MQFVAPVPMIQTDLPGTIAGIDIGIRDRDAQEVDLVVFPAPGAVVVDDEAFAGGEKETHLSGMKIDD